MTKVGRGPDLTFEYPLGDVLAQILAEVPSPATGEILVLPERVGRDAQGPWVAFRSEAKLIRAAAAEPESRTG